jgi:hypothetical protein
MVVEKGALRRDVQSLLNRKRSFVFVTVAAENVAGKDAQKYVSSSYS